MQSNLYQDFDFSLLNDPEFKEDSVREELILPFLKMLNYKPFGKNRIIRSKTLTHPYVKTGASRRNVTSIPDYLFEVNGEYSWVLDAKAGDGEKASCKKTFWSAWLFHQAGMEIRSGVEEMRSASGSGRKKLKALR